MNELPYLLGFIAKCFPSSLENIPTKATWILCVDTDAGQLAWQVTENDADILKSMGIGINMGRYPFDVSPSPLIMNHKLLKLCQAIKPTSQLKFDRQLLKKDDPDD